MTTYTIPQRMLDAAICAYAIDSKGQFNPDNQYYAPIGIDGDVKVLEGGDYEIDAGFIATTKADPTTAEQWVVLAFRGTLASFHFDSWNSICAFIDDWWQDDETRMVPMSVDNTIIGHVEQGFKQGLDKLWLVIAAELDKVDWSKVSGIQITGHSKGAAMTFLAAAMIKIKYPKARTIQVHAFAAPLAGDPAFASWYDNNHLGVATTRYQRIDDIVPYLPPSVSWNLFHHLPGTWHPFGILIEAELKTLSWNVHGGYQEVGSLVALVTDDRTNSQMRIRGDQTLRHAIIHAIRVGDGERIAHAHSAVKSYWPALFGTSHA